MDGHAPRPLLWQVLSPLIFAAVPSLRGFMRDPRALPLKRWLYRTFLDPYTNLRPDRFETTSIYGARFEGTLSGLVQRRLFHFGIFEPNLTDWIWNALEPGDVFVDVGANVGYFTLLAARAVGPAGSVVAIEPAPSTFAALCSNLERNGATNVRALNLAAFDREAVMPIYTIQAEENAGGASLAKVVGPVEAEITARPLAQMLTGEEIARTRVIKIDVEGAEVAAVTGLLPLLERIRFDVAIVVEVLPETKADVCGLLGRFGLRPRELTNPPDPLTSPDRLEYLIFSR
ncbi:MAG TPA: FkbM family methyltransferase [Candidatus Binatia bacterium]|nr:FkbM family methyltransferase [Candidatus Binatia bacterium]